MAPGPLSAAARAVPRIIAAQQLDAAENEEASQRVGLLAGVPGLLRELGANPGRGCGQRRSGTGSNPGGSGQAKGDLDLALRLRRTLRTMLLAQNTSAEQVARVLLMHRRTLNRRLKAEGTTFQALLDEVRFETACQLLDMARIPVTAIAVSLGYSETSGFSRAFRRWSGATPVERRRRYQKEPCPGEMTAKA